RRRRRVLQALRGPGARLAGTSDIRRETYAGPFREREEQEILGDDARCADIPLQAEAVRARGLTDAARGAGRDSAAAAVDAGGEEDRRRTGRRHLHAG